MKNQYFIYTVFYFIISQIALLRFYSKKKCSIILYEYLYISLFLVFFCLSCSVGSDWKEYKSFFLWTTQNDLSSIMKVKLNMEYPYRLFVYVISRVTSEYAVFRAIISAVIFFGLRKVFQLIFEKNYIIPFTCYLICYGNKLLISTLRQALAIIIIFAFYYFYEKSDNKKRAFFLLCLGFLFHYSAVFIVFPLIIYRGFRRKATYYVITGVLFISLILKFDLATLLLNFVINNFIGKNQLTRKLLIYLSGTVETNVSILDIFYVFLFIFLIIRTKKLTLWHAVSFSFIFLLCMFPNNGIFLSRLRYYLGIAFFYLIFKETIINKNIIILVCFLFCFLTNTVTYYGSDQWSLFVPYKNVIIQTFLVPEEDLYFMGDEKPPIYYQLMSNQ